MANSEVAILTLRVSDIEEHIRDLQGTKIRMQDHPAEEWFIQDVDKEIAGLQYDLGEAKMELAHMMGED
jgi:hypothetical protein